MGNRIDIKNPLIDILLPLYNSSIFLEELFTSIVNQTYSNWKLIIRDDGSTDNTNIIVEELKSLFPEKVIFLKDNFKNLGPQKSYEKLLEKSTAEYIMFCDHDDIWLPFKIEKTLNILLENEQKYPNLPIIVHTDLTVVDDKLKVINDSFFRISKLNQEYANSFYKLSVCNVVTGCTMIFNKKAKEISLPIHNNSIMHDWWLALKTSLYGKIIFIPQSTILYRQHTQNNVGAKNISFEYYLNRLKKIKTTLNDNYKLYKMIKSLNPKVKVYKLVYHKIIILTSKTFN